MELNVPLQFRPYFMNCFADHHTHKGDLGCCSMTRGRRGGVQPGGLKKIYFYNNIYLFLTHAARCCNFCNVSFNFDWDAKEMN